MTLREMYMEAKKADRKALREFNESRTRETHKLIRRCADACMVKENTVKSWVLGYREPDELAKQELAKALNCDINELFN
jgi:hypothetical protein